jgi:hypothetical protein
MSGLCSIAAETLAGSSFDAGARAFLSWLGVTRHRLCATVRICLAEVAG